MARKLPVMDDPAINANKRILKNIELRQKQKATEESLDLGLKIPELAADSKAETAAELLRDEWDKKHFGPEIKTTTRIIYGPDPIVNNCPEFHDRLERFGLEAIAESYYELIMQKGEFAAPDAIMQKGIRMSIAKFGKEATAKAFRDRVMQIPSRTVEIEVDTALDPLLQNPMREAVARYGRPGMAVKFLSDHCNDVLGMRGYEVCKKPNGDIVKVGTLIMAEIPEEMAERRRRHWAKESTDQLTEMEENYFEMAQRTIRDSKVAGVSPLQPGDMVRSDSRINDDWLDDTRATGIKIGRDRAV
jgi:hypothetical protein